MGGQQAFDQRQQDDRARQDAQLDQIYNGVRGLKGQAHAINGEVVEQNAMIDDLGNVSPSFSFCWYAGKRGTDREFAVSSAWTMPTETWSDKRGRRGA
jgi:hypothetical protein